MRVLMAACTATRRCGALAANPARHFACACHGPRSAMPLPRAGSVPAPLATPARRTWHVAGRPASVPRAMSGGAAGPDGTSFVACYVTVPSQDVAEKIAGPLLEQRLAACVNIIPGVQSMYWWQGKVEKDAELLLMIKTRASLVDKLTEAVVALHPYDVCEVISVPITGGNPPYLTWVADSTSAGAAQ
ncbi:unnamed protein product [Pedinophyceae sp. YPF-701]|nr:unnamed protein product [Pedinophyceae sp. YPF-701]